MKKNKLTTAVVAGIAGVAGIASVSNAVYLNDKGVGEVLIYPYYTVQNNLNTLVSVVNTTANVKAIKVRFLEGDNSQEVLDFNVYMSPYDVWTGAVSLASSGVGQVSSDDKSCAPGFDGYKPFSTLYAANAEATTHGHFEIIDMGVVDPTLRSSGSTAGLVAASAIHRSGVPSCVAVTEAWTDGPWGPIPGGASNTGMIDDFGGLFGGAIIVNPAEGFAVSYEAIALQDFWAADPAAHTNPGMLTPSLVSGVINSVVYLDGMALNSTWSEGYQAVSAVLMKDRLYNEYYAEEQYQGGTEWVVTFPTKTFHVAGPAIEPFSNVWAGGQSCEYFNMSVWDREEQAPTSGIPVSPTVNNRYALCQETNVINFSKASAAPGVGDPSNILGDTNLVNVDIGDYQSGWATIGFAESSQRTSLVTAGGTAAPGSATFNGLPVVGFAVIKAKTGSTDLANYGVLFDHRSRVTSN